MGRYWYFKNASNIKIFQNFKNILFNEFISMLIIVILYLVVFPQIFYWVVFSWNFYWVIYSWNFYWVVFSWNFSCSKSESKVTKHLDALLTSSDCVGLYIKVLELIKSDLETQETRGFTRNVSKIRAQISDCRVIKLIFIVKSLTYH